MILRAQLGNPKVVRGLEASQGFNHSIYISQLQVCTPFKTFGKFQPPRISLRRSEAIKCSLVERDGTRTASPSGRNKTFDVVALSNLCVDIVLHLDEVPPAYEVKSEDMLRRLSAQPPDIRNWEVGGSCNLLIAAARLGMSAATIGNLGDDVYGDFVRKILKEEGVDRVEPLAPVQNRAELRETLLCFVLVAPNSAHAFCSRYDFGPWPLLPGISQLPPGAAEVLADTRAIFANGFIFDELPAEVVVKAMRVAREAGAAVFFDPGPRCWTMSKGPRRAALESVMDLCDVILMTEEEALAVTGFADPEDAARAILARPGAHTEWCVVKLGARGALLCIAGHDTAYYQAALEVEVQDTVGCGDSFAAAVVLGYTRKQPIPALLALANAVGAATATGAGAGRNVARASTVLDLLAREAAKSDGAANGKLNGNGKQIGSVNGGENANGNVKGSALPNGSAGGNGNGAGWQMNEGWEPAATALDLLQMTLDEAEMR